MKKRWTREYYLDNYSNGVDEFYCYKSGATIKISPEDFEKCSVMSWYVEEGYARSGKFKDYPNEKVNVKLHRYVMGCVPYDKKIIDHIDMNKLDNRRENLRFATPQLNNVNRKLSCANKSGFKGVSYKPRLKTNPWLASIGHNYKYINIGYYPTAKEAAIAWDKQAIAFRGQNTTTNKSLGLI